MQDTKTKKSLSYREAGVNIETGNQLVTRIKPIAELTKRHEVLSGLGGFAALYELPTSQYRNPVLVSSTDGVGTKQKLALTAKTFNNIGIDLVAMCVNDIIVYGAEPLFFLDYYATGKLVLDQAETIVRSIGQGCQQAGVALVGGETAELPGLYRHEDYDLAGFAVGIVEKREIIDGKSVIPGNTLIGLASSGPHANGYSLINTLLERKRVDLTELLAGKTLAELLLAPTKIYTKSILSLIKKIQVNAIAHITGGGIIDNLPRVLPQKTKAVITANYWQIADIFLWIQEQGQIEWEEMYRTFNCGIGMVICVAKQDADKTLDILEQNGEKAWPIGTIENRKVNEPCVIFT